MNASFYKEYFEIQLRHASAADEICTSFSLTPNLKCKESLQNLRMTFRNSPGVIMVSYSGGETAIHSDILAPFPGVSNGTEFIFIVSADNKKILNTTRVLAEPAIHVGEFGKVIPWHFIKPAVFSYTFDHTASTKLYEEFTVETEGGALVYQTTIKKAVKPGDDPDGIYLCSVDLRFSDPGIYSLKLGTGVKNFYVDTTGEMAGNYGFIRYKKDATWLTPTDLRFGIPIDYNQFIFTFELPS